MSDGLHNVAAMPFQVTIGEKEYTLSPLTLGIYAEVGQHVLSQRVDPLEHLKGKMDGYSEAQQAVLLRVAFEQSQAQKAKPRASTSEVDDFIGTLEGTQFVMWRLMEPHHPEIDSVKKAAEIMEKLDEAGVLSLQEKIKDASGITAMEAVAKKSKRRARKGQGKSRGPSSTGT